MFSGSGCLLFGYHQIAWLSPCYQVITRLSSLDYHLVIINWPVHCLVFRFWLLLSGYHQFVWLLPYYQVITRLSSLDYHLVMRLSPGYHHLIIICLWGYHPVIITWLSPCYQVIITLLWPCYEVITRLSSLDYHLVIRLSPGYHHLTCPLSYFQVLFIFIWLSPVCLITLLSGYYLPSLSGYQFILFSGSILIISTCLSPGYLKGQVTFFKTSPCLSPLSSLSHLPGRANENVWPLSHSLFFILCSLILASPSSLNFTPYLSNP